MIAFQLSNHAGVLFEGQFSGRALFGRQKEGEPTPRFFDRPSQFECPNNRFLIAELNDISISRDQLEVFEAPGDRLEIKNTSSKFKLAVLDTPISVGPKRSEIVALPVALKIGGLQLRFERFDALPSLAHIPLGPGKTLRLTPKPLKSLSSPEIPTNLSSASVSFPPNAAMFPSIQPSVASPPGLDLANLQEWLQATLSVLHTAASSEQFFARSAAALTDLFDMDLGCILLRGPSGSWRVETCRPPQPTDWSPSQHVLDNVAANKKTFFKNPRVQYATESVQKLHAIVASPILDAEGAVVGMLYGERRRNIQDVGIEPIEGVFIEVLAGGVAAGLARVQEERAASHLRSQLEMYFTPELARKIEDDASLLEGTEKKVTVLFVDIRGYSRLSRNVGPSVTMNMIREIMTCLCDCVLSEKGTVVDYSGDELMAMWGAAADQPDQAARACRTAQQMVESLPTLNRQLGSQERIINFGIGINSGIAQVGNVGSHRKVKYGAMGTTVNLASRLQGINKKLHTNIIVAESTALEGEMDQTRRLTQVLVAGIPDPVMIHELPISDSPGWFYLRGAYETALNFFERQDFHQCVRVLGEILSRAEHRQDGPTLQLMRRAVECLTNPPTAFSPVWELLEK